MEKTCAELQTWWQCRQRMGWGEAFLWVLLLLVSVFYLPFEMISWFGGEDMTHELIRLTQEGFWDKESPHYNDNNYQW